MAAALTRSCMVRCSTRAMAVVLSLMMVTMVVVSMAEGACPSTSQLAGACSQYVVGANPPVPTPAGACCSLLKGSTSSCLCNSIPASARSLVSKKGLSQVHSACKLPYTCPGF